MTDHLAKERGKIQREILKSNGWKELKLWVRSDADAMEVRQLIAEQTKRYSQIILDKMKEELNMSTGSFNKLAAAIHKQGSNEYVTPHGAFSEYLSEIIRDGNLTDVEPATKIYSMIYPTSIQYALKTLPAKVLNYLCSEMDSKYVVIWTEENPDWASQIHSSLAHGEFSQFVSNLKHKLGSNHH